ncbi:MAG: replication-associated recombination protein A, partial [Planctomycetota bacterium]
MSDLFADQRRQQLEKALPLAARMRPRTLDEFAGQQHFLGEGKLLRRMIDADRLTSLLFYGPPGTGKTTLGRIIAHATASEFEHLNAAQANVKEVRAVLDEACERLENGGARTLLFLDELHRFNKNQQDILLGDVESGVITLIGATTENPFFAVNSALVSRSQIFQFQPLKEDDVRRLLKRAVADDERGFGKLDLTVTEDALNHLTVIADGDARRALTGLEIAVVSQQKAGEKSITIDLGVAEESMQRKAVLYDRLGDQHYDHASALIKSMRASDPDSAVYWLARMLDAGEDPRFIARRVAIFASEDIGNADPRAVQVASSCYDLTLKLGLPECQLTLSQAVLYMATAPKSRASTRAIGAATTDVREARTIPVPLKWRDAHYAGAKQLGHGKH